jgi:hypothetical protein
MEWNTSAIEKLSVLFLEKYRSMFSDMAQDRQNRSAIWNKYLKNYSIKVVRNDIPGKAKAKAVLRSNDIVLKNLIEIINGNNDCVSSAVIIANPDRYGQFLLVSRDIAERVLVLGMM